MRRRYASTSAWQVSVRARIAEWTASIVVSSTRKRVWANVGGATTTRTKVARNRRSMKSAEEGWIQIVSDEPPPENPPPPPKSLPPLLLESKDDELLP